MIGQTVDEWARGPCELTRLLPLLTRGARGESGSNTPKLWWRVRARDGSIVDFFWCFGLGSSIRTQWCYKNVIWDKI